MSPHPADISFFICNVGDETQGFPHATDKCSTTELHPQTSVFWNRVPLHNSGLPTILCSCELTIPLPRLLHSRVAALCHHTLTRLVSLKYKEETPRGLGRWLGERNALCKKEPEFGCPKHRWELDLVIQTCNCSEDRQISGAQWPPWGASSSVREKREKFQKGNGCVVSIWYSFWHTLGHILIFVDRIEAPFIQCFTMCLGLFLMCWYMYHD